MDQLKPNPANSAPLTPLSFLERAAIVYADEPSTVYNTAVTTWSQTYRRCLQGASALVSLGIKRRDVVSVVAPNIPAMYELQFAIPMSGAVLNNINTRLDARALSVILKHGESKLVFVDHAFRPLVLDAVSLLPKGVPRPLLILIADEGDNTNQRATLMHPFIDTYERFIYKGDPTFEWIRPGSDWDPISLTYTSGTTAAPKGVVHCHRGNFIVALDTIIEASIPRRSVYLWTLPMFHGNGWSFTWVMAAVGGTNICLRKFKAETIYAAVRRHGVTHFCAVPAVLNMICNFPAATPLGRRVEVITAGAPPPATILSKTEALGFVVSHSYGLTETGGQMVSCTWKKNWDKLPANERARLKARQGVRTLCTTAVDIIDPITGKSVPADGKSLGEIVLRGASLTLGYLKDPKGTYKVIKDDGWFRTGDVGVMYPDGYLEIKDRSKDVIISGGENISSVEVESVLYSHLAINEAAVVAKPDERWGETPCAFVSMKAGQKTTEKEIIEYCRERLPRYMVPKTVVFRRELPRTSTGKIQKFVLREMAMEIAFPSRIQSSL